MVRLILQKYDDYERPGKGMINFRLMVDHTERALLEADLALEALCLQPD